LISSDIGLFDLDRFALIDMIISCKVGNEPNEPNIRGSLLVSSRTNQHFFARSPQRAERRPDAARSLGERAARLARSARSQGWKTSVRSRFSSVQYAGPTILEMESDRTDSRMNLDRTEPRPIQKQRRPTDRSSPWMTIGPDWTDAHINLGRDMRCSLRLSLKRHKQSSVMLHTQNEVKFEDYTDDVA